MRTSLVVLGIEEFVFSRQEESMERVRRVGTDNNGPIEEGEEEEEGSEDYSMADENGLQIQNS